MPQKSGLINEREREICARVRLIRKQINWSQVAVANRLQMTRAAYVNIESALTPLRWHGAFDICRIFNIQIRWLLAGKGDIRPFYQPFWTRQERSKLRQTLLASQVYDDSPGKFDPLIIEGSHDKDTFKGSIPDDFDFKKGLDFHFRYYCNNINFRDQYCALEFLRLFKTFLKSKTEKFINEGKATKANEFSLEPLVDFVVRENNEVLTCDTPKSIKGIVSPQMPKLIQRVRQKASKPGAKAELARLLGVAPARIYEWLSEQKEPGGEYTLQLLKWVEQKWRQQKSPGGA